MAGLAILYSGCKKDEVNNPTTTHEKEIDAAKDDALA